MTTHELTDAQRAYAIWLATPEEHRDPPTRAALAAELGIDRITLWRWNKLPGLLDESRALTMERLGDAFSQVCETVKTRAIAGDHKCIEMYFSLVGASQYVAGANASQVTVKEPPQLMTDEEATAILERAGVLRARIIPHDDDRHSAGLLPEKV